MGREVTCSYVWAGIERQGKVLLEPEVLILSGRPRIALPRNGMTARIVPKGLEITSPLPDGPLILHLPAADAAAWLRAIAKPPPDLAAKLGVAAGPVVVLGQITDPALATALQGATCPSAQGAVQALAVILTPDDLARALAFAASHPALPIWAVNEKGRRDFGESVIRAAFRAANLVDTKACAVSDRLSASRYSPRK